MLLVLPVVDVLPDPAVVSSFRPLVSINLDRDLSVPPPVALVWRLGPRHRFAVIRWLVGVAVRDGRSAELPQYQRLGGTTA